MDEFNVKIIKPDLFFINVPANFKFFFKLIKVLGSVVMVIFTKGLFLFMDGCIEQPLARLLGKNLRLPGNTLLIGERLSQRSKFDVMAHCGV
ncbi:hypothetical protein DDZ16_01060 [Marinilabilia rubra]|uniref:Uncharacterized protein n=1 Tax=Marinilabilia rubra TaxID=2162893 RepID=A0A2U2BDK1_9BACT|nr:hypothetical protein DDZ16_01060 [Marinilabilia rubra]